MAHEYTTWAYAQAIDGAGCKFVLVALADAANADGYSYPGQRRLATMTGQSDRAVRRHLAWLEAEGYIKREERRREDGTRTSDGYLLPCRDVSTGQIGRWSTGQSGHLTTGQIGHLMPGEDRRENPDPVMAEEPRVAREIREEIPAGPSTGQIGHLVHQPARLAGHEPKEYLLPTSLSNLSTTTPPTPPSPRAAEFHAPTPEQLEVVEQEDPVKRAFQRPMGQHALNHLVTFNRDIWSQLFTFRRLHAKPVNDQQFMVWAQRVKEDLETHGEAAVREALNVTIESFAQLEWPFPFYRGVVKRVAQAALNPPAVGRDGPGTGESGGGGVLGQLRVEDLIKQAKEGTL